VSPIKWVFLKEVREMLRDKRTRGVALFGPIFLMVFFVCGFGTIIGGVMKPQAQTIHYVGGSDPLLAALTLEGVKLSELKSVGEAERLIRTEKARLVIEIGSISKDPGVPQTIRAFYDPKQQKALIALALVRKEVAKLSSERLKRFLTSSKLPASASEPIQINEKAVTVGEAGAGEFIVGMLPYLIVIWAFYGGFALATDLVAGEKEKNTLETLLITPVTRTQIVLGKFFSLSLLCLVSALASVLGLVLVAVLKLPGSDFMLKDGLGITPVAAIVTLVVLIPTVAMFASLLLAFSTYAKNSREAQSYISLASFVVVIPAAFSQLIGLTDAANQSWVNFVPVLNTANNIRNALLGKPDWVGTMITVAVSGAIAVVLLAAVIQLFNREQVLTRV
jgi:sodium transport system permease protein